jgi:hypothetical protein
MIYAALVVIALGLVTWLVHRLRADGSNEQKLNQAEKVLDEIHDANAARRAIHTSDSLRDDPHNRDNGV